jgi:hypothetical protein
MNRLDHPAVKAWLARLDTEASVLPDEQRAALGPTPRTSIVGALAGTVPTTRRSKGALAELGEPAEIVAETAGYVLPPVESDVAPEDAVAAERAAPGSRRRRSDCSRHPSCSRSCRDRGGGPGPLVPRHPHGAAVAAVDGGDKGIAVLAFGVLGVPLILLGRDELPTTASVVVSVALVAGWLAAARGCCSGAVAARAGPWPADALTAVERSTPGRVDVDRPGRGARAAWTPRGRPPRMGDRPREVRPVVGQKPMPTHVVAAGHGRRVLLRLVGDDGLGGEEQRGDRRGVLQRGARDLRRVDDAGRDEVDVLAGRGVQAPAGSRFGPSPRRRHPRGRR